MDTHRRPRTLNDYSSKLKINCNHASRGCFEFVCVEYVKTHAANSGSAPMTCSDDDCGEKFNKKDKAHHETVHYEYRTVKCYDCEQIREDVGTLCGSLVERERKVEAMG